MNTNDPDTAPTIPAPPPAPYAPTQELAWRMWLAGIGELPIPRARADETARLMCA